MLCGQLPYIHMHVYAQATHERAHTQLPVAFYALSMLDVAYVCPQIYLGTQSCVHAHE